EQRLLAVAVGEELRLALLVLLGLGRARLLGLREQVVERLRARGGARERELRREQERETEHDLARHEWDSEEALASWGADTGATISSGAPCLSATAKPFFTSAR